MLDVLRLISIIVGIEKKPLFFRAASFLSSLTGVNGTTVRRHKFLPTPG